MDIATSTIPTVADDEFGTRLIEIGKQILLVGVEKSLLGTVLVFVFLLGRGLGQRVVSYGNGKTINKRTDRNGNNQIGSRLAMTLTE